MPDSAHATGRGGEGLLLRAVGALGGAAAWLFALAVVITVWEVVARYAFSAPTTWAHASVTALCAVAFALGGAYAERRGEHMRVASLVDRLSAARQKVCALVAVICGAVYLAGLGCGAWMSAHEAVWRFESTAAGLERWVPEPLPGPPGWPLPALVKVALLTGTLLFLLVLLRRAVNTLRKRPG